jgi:hypothetical protein
MTTCEPLPDGGDDDQPLTLWPEDSPASPSPARGRASRRLTRGGSGQRSQVSFATYDLTTCLWKTSRVSLGGEWETYSATWPASGMTRSGTAFRRPTSVRPIYVSESGLWPTPQTINRKSRRAMTPWENTGRHGDGGQSSPPGLEQAVELAAGIIPRELTGMPLPPAVQRFWATPTAHPRTHSPRPVHHGQQLANQVGGLLNPLWVEWLMGYPPNWTDCEDSVTPSSHRSPSTSDG